ncbi:hypothetical protein PQR33_32975 [Paraburkholderia sediminicola]|uniref:hypothetical protein n=1 Tax=Paraburkholderia sediminicola TaxID=458836 RepID=UPI0038BD32E1
MQNVHVIAHAPAGEARHGKSINIASLPGEGATDTPNPFEGEMALGEVQLILKALKWANDSAEGNEGLDAFQTLADALWPTLLDHVETARRAISACRSLQEAEVNHE